MEINKALFARYAELDTKEQKALEDDNIGAYREASVALIEIINELEGLGLEFKVIDETLCLVAKQQEHRFHRFRRSYQFPNAVKTIENGNAFAWIVNEFGDVSLYGVVRYIAGGDRWMWVESDAHFGVDVNAAEQWVRETIALLKAGK